MIRPSDVVELARRSLVASGVLLPDKPWDRCTGCGACCTQVAHIPDLVRRGFVLANGTCRHFDPGTKGCRIYAKRPTVCRVMRLRPAMLDEGTWSDINAVACDALHVRDYGVEREADGPCRHRRTQRG